MSQHREADETAEAVVIGAGIVGVSCALALQADGRDVLLVDRDGPGEGCSKGNAGHIAVEHIAPVPTLATLRAAPRLLLERNGPLSLHWPYLPRLAPWLTQFVWASRPAQVARATRAIAALNAGAMAAFERLDRKAGLSDLIHRNGAVMVAGRKTSFAALRKDAARADTFGIRSEVLSGRELAGFDPSLSGDLAGGVYYPEAGHVGDPYTLVQRLADSFTAGGGRLRRMEVTGLSRGWDGWRVHGADGEDLRAQRCVLAAGAHSARLAAPLGYSLPLETARGYHYTALEPGTRPRVPLGAVDQRFMVTPMDMGVRIGGRLEFAGLERRMNRMHAEKLLALAQRLIPGLEAGPHELWMGHRPMLPDSLPVIDRAPYHPGLYFAFGHQHLGLTQGPVTGELVADLMAERAPAIDLTPFRVDRF